MNALLVRGLFDATNRRDIEALRAVYASRFLLNGAETAFDDFAASFPAFFAAFPDAVGTVHECLVEGDAVAARWTTTATHLGDYGGATASGRQVSWSGINIYRIRDGRVVEMWQSSDTFGLLRQIGAIAGEQPPQGRQIRTEPRAPLIRLDVRRPSNDSGTSGGEGSTG